MPICVIPGLQAIENRNNRDLAGWPGRNGAANRVEPIAMPGIGATFQLRRGEPIFTIGSCFARHIERELEDRGYQLPVRALLKSSEFKAHGESILNNYGVPSIRQELAWAFDPAAPFDPATGFIEAFPGKFCDLHLPNGMRPDPLDVVQRRRQAIIACTRLIRSCRVVIITLGLTEVWWDHAARAYVNETPRPSLIRKWPERFELRVLDSGETLEQLRAALALIRANAAEGVQVILTVSPVPMTATHRPVDVMVANTYSKAALRVAAETVCAELDFVHYFPSYESVVLSDRSIAWEEDQVHVTQALVRTNVTRMLKHYDTSVAVPMTAIEVLAEHDRLQPEGIRRQWDFLSEHRDAVHGHAALAARYVRLAINRGDLPSAREVVAAMPPLEVPFHREFLETELHLAEHRAADALELLDRVDAQALPAKLERQIRRDIWRLRTLVHLDSGNDDAAIGAAVAWARAAATNAQYTTPLLTLGRSFRDRGKLVQAAHYFDQIAAERGEDSSFQLEYAELLVRVGRIEKALAIADSITPNNPADKRRLDLIRAFAFPGATPADDPAQTPSSG
jgi:hypothetical protein